jgi:GDPmannose 4,6-dehydratase
MWLMLQQDEPRDYVIASGVTHSVRELAAIAFDRVGLDWEEYVHVDESLKRGKAELHDLVGDSTKARERLGWQPALNLKEAAELTVTWYRTTAEAASPGACYRISVDQIRQYESRWHAAPEA